MTRVGVAQIKARLSHYLKRVKAGQEVIITDHGLPIDAEREQLIREGLLITGKGEVRGELLVAPKGDPKWGRSVLEALLEERREGR